MERFFVASTGQMLDRGWMMCRNNRLFLLLSLVFSFSWIMLVRYELAFLQAWINITWGWVGHQIRTFVGRRRGGRGGEVCIYHKRVRFLLLGLDLLREVPLNQLPTLLKSAQQQMDFSIMWTNVPIKAQWTISLTAHLIKKKNYLCKSDFPSQISKVVQFNTDTIITFHCKGKNNGFHT